MRLQLKFFASFREFFQDRYVELHSGANVRDLLDLLCDSSKRRGIMFDDNGLKPYVTILKNGKHIHDLNGPETTLEDGDTVVMFPPVGGG